MSTLSSLKATRRRLENRKKELEADLKVQRNRLNKVEKLPARIMEINAERYDAVNAQLNRAADSWVAMVRLDDSGIMQTRAADMSSGEKEAYCVNDTCLGQAIDELYADACNTRQKIATLESNIDSVKLEISGVEEQIRAEEQRLEEERREKLRQMLTSLFTG